VDQKSSKLSRDKTGYYSKFMYNLSLMKGLDPLQMLTTVAMRIRKLQ